MKRLIYIFLLFIPFLGQCQDTVDELLLKAEEKQNRLPELISIYYKVLQLDSCNYEALFGQGKAYYSRWKILGRVDKIYLDSAYIQFNKACNVQNVDYRAFIARGDYYSDFEHFQEAFNDFSTAIKIAPEQYYVRFRRALIYMRWQDFENALIDLNLFINNYQDILDNIYILRATCFANLKMFPDCKKDVEKALSINPKANDNILALVDYYAITGQYKKAINKYSFIINRNNAFALAYLKRGSVFYAMDEKEKAKNDWDTALAKGITVNERSKKIKFGK